MITTIIVATKNKKVNAAVNYMYPGIVTAATIKVVLNPVHCQDFCETIANI